MWKCIQSTRFGKGDRERAKKREMMMMKRGRRNRRKKEGKKKIDNQPEHLNYGEDKNKE